MTRVPPRAPALLLLALAGAACRASAPPVPVDAASSSAPATPALASASIEAPADVPRPLPKRWDAMPVWDFEQLVARLEPAPWTEAARGSLGFALLADDLRSVRAAVLLAHGSEASAELLLEHLEAREPEPERGGDAAEVVAAAALRRFATDERRARLAALASGPDPHPDIEVRVECGVLALDLGADEVAPFLVRVLRAGTPAELEDPFDWPPQATMAWVKGRASDALSRRAGIENPYDADSSWAAQMAAANVLSEAVSGGL